MILTFLYKPTEFDLKEFEFNDYDGSEDFFDREEKRIVEYYNREEKRLNAWTRDNLINLFIRFTGDISIALLWCFLIMIFIK